MPIKIIKFNTLYRSLNLFYLLLYLNTYSWILYEICLNKEDFLKNVLKRAMFFINKTKM